MNDYIDKDSTDGTAIGRHKDQSGFSLESAATVDLQNRVKRLEEQAAPTVPLKEALRAMSRDMHQASTRPCSTCRMISNVMGEPFGCSALAIEVAKRKKA